MGNGTERSAWSAKVVLVSFTLLFAFMTPIVLFNFPILKQSTIRVTPERYLHAAVYSLIAAILTGLILTRSYTKIDYQHTLLIEWYGYNNVCIYFDFVPARYVVCIYVWFMGFFGVNYCLEDIKRLRTLRYLSPRVRSLATNVDRLFMVACCSLPIWPCITPEENMRMHTAPFLALIIAMPMIFITRLLILPSHPSSVHLASVASFTQSKPPLPLARWQRSDMSPHLLDTRLISYGHSLPLLNPSLRHRSLSSSIERTIGWLPLSSKTKL
jgi:hypothetical protein